MCQAIKTGSEVPNALKLAAMIQKVSGGLSKICGQRAWCSVSQSPDRRMFLLIVL
jgi:hypothetical protein